MVTVNAMGDNCPDSVVIKTKAMQALTGPETIEVLVDNEIAVQNVTKLAKEQGGEVSSEKLGEKRIQSNNQDAGEYRQQMQKLYVHRIRRETLS